MLLITGLLTGCATHLPPPPPAPALKLAASTGYQVQVGDQLGIRLFLTPELNEDVTVRPDGRITTQLAEAVPAAGHTPEAVAAALRTIYRGELKDPRITVEVKSYAPVRVTVAGEVTSPGEVSTQGPPPTLLAAVARAGGLRLTGDADHVLLIRRGPNNHPAVFATRFADAFSGRDPAADITLQPYDIIVVPKTGVAELYVWVNQHIQQFVPVSWGFSYEVNPLASTLKR
jgi:protein involved in polysaccharide export with SLBB domain